MTELPPPPPPHPTGWLALTVQGSKLTSSLIPPMATINGVAARTSYGRQVFPVCAGSVHLDVRCQWLRSFGEASLVVTIDEGQTVEVFYALPMHRLTKGNLGYEKQKRPGLALFLLLMTVVLVAVGFASAVLGAVVAS